MIRSSLAFACFVLIGCGSTVVDQPAGDSAGAGASGSGGAGPGSVGSATGTGGEGGCGGSTFDCVQACATDYFNQAECVGSIWKCPSGWFPASDCKNPCFGAPLTCETCGENGWQCEPTPECPGTCPGLVCLSCPDVSGPAILGACECSCTSEGYYTCDLAPGCCNVDMDCGDIVYTPCVENVCKTPVSGGCWVDAECPPDQKCIGASVCHCGYDCDGPDQPGKCG